ncbi:hypothetical protein ACHWQZ_G002927 [Mnemiopsis leidyi]
MPRYIRILLFLSFVLQSTTETKVGLLISKSDSYNNALKSLSSYAIQDTNTSVTLVTVEYDDKLQSMVEACCQLVTLGVSAIITKGSSSSTAIQSDILSPLKIPHLAVSATDPFLWNKNREYLIRLSSSDSYQSRAIYDLIKHYKWPEVSILASADSYGLNGMVELENLLIADTFVTIKDMLFFSTENCTAENIHHQLNTIRHSLVKVVVLNAGAKVGKCVLESAHQMGLMGAEFVWMVTDAIGAQPESLAEHDGNFLSIYEGLIGIRPAQDKGDQYKSFQDSYVVNGGKVDDLTSYTILTYDAVGLIANALKAVTEDASQNIQCSSESGGWNGGKAVLNALLKTNYSAISGEISFTNDGERRYPSYDILNFVDNKFTSVGRWTNSSGLKLTNAVEFLGGITTAPSGVAKNLIGRHLRLGSVEEQPFMFFATEGCEGNDCWSGMVNDMVVKLSEDLGFTYEYIQPDDRKFGALNKTTNEWNGMIRDLLDDKTDMIAIDLSTNSARKSAIDYSFPFMDAGIKAVVKGESGTGNKFFFLSPFDGSVWSMVFVMNFILVGLICCLGKLSPFGKYGAKLHAVKTCTCEDCKAQRSEMETKHCSLQDTKKYDCLIEEVEEEDRSTDASLYNSLWLISTGLVGQTSEALPHCLSGRFLVLTWWAFMLITMSMYTANLTASLTLNNLGITLNQVLELLDQDKYKWGVIGSRHPETLLKTHRDSRYSRLVDEGVELKDLNHAIETLRGGLFVFIDEGPVLAHNLISDCDVFSVGEEFQSFEYAFGLPKDSPYKSLIDSHLLKFREEGFIDILWEKWSSGNSVCSQSGIGKKVTLDMNTLAGVFYLLLSGVGISFVLFLVEFVYVTARDSSLVKDLTFIRALKRRIRFILEDFSRQKDEKENCENNSREGQTIENYCTDVDI